MRSYGNTASAMGKDLNQMIEAVADASVGEFERLKEFGIKASSEGDQVALTFQGVTTTIGKNSREIQDYLLAIGNVQFAGAMDRQMDTLGGAISNVKDALLQAWVALGDSGLTDAVVRGLKWIADWIGEISDNMKLADFNGWMEDLKGVAGAAAGATGVYLTFSAAVELATVAMDALAVGQAAVNAVMALNPIGQIALAIGVAVTALSAFGGYLFAVRNDMTTFGETSGTVGDLVKATWEEVASRFSEAWDGVTQNISDAFDALGIDIDEVARQAEIVFSSILSGAAEFAEEFISTWVGVGSSIGSVAAYLVTTFSNAFSDIGAIAKAAWADITSGNLDFSGTKAAIAAAWQEQLSAADTLVESIQANFDGSVDYVGKVKDKAVGLADDIEERFKRISLERSLDDQLGAEFDAAIKQFDALDRGALNAASGTDKLTGATTALSKAQSDANKTATAMIKQFEGLNLNAYWDHAGYSIGYGHQSPEIKVGMRIDLDQAEKYLKEDVAKFEDVVRSVVTVSLSDSQAAALTSLAYNIGEGAFSNSTLVKLLNLGDYEAAAGEFDKWTKVTVNGLKQTSDALVRRRDLEEEVFRGAGSLSAATSALAQKDKEAAKQQEKLNATRQQAREILAGLNADWDSLADQYDTSYAASKRFKQSQSEISQLLATGRMTADEYARALQYINLEYQRSQGPMAAWLAYLEESIGTFDEFTVDVMDSFVDNLADGLADGRLEFDDFVDDVKRMLARIAVNTIAVNLVGSVTGIGSPASGVAGAAGAAGSASSLSGLGNLSSLANLFGGNSLGLTAGRGIAYAAGSLGYGSNALGAGVGNLAGMSNWMLGGSALAGGLLGSALFDGGYSDAGSSIGSTAGAVIGSMILPGIGTALGSLLGGAGGGFLGSLFGGGETRQGNYATSFSGAGFEDDVKASGAFGLNFGLQDKGSNNIKASEFQDVFDGMAAVSTRLSEFYGKGLSDQIQADLRDRLGDFNGWGKDLDESFQKIFTSILDAANTAEGEAGDGAGHLLKVAVGDLGGTAEQMAQQIEGGLAKVNTVLSLWGTEAGERLGFGLEGVLDSQESAVRAMSDWVAEFARSGESTVETLGRLVSGLVSVTSAAELTTAGLGELSGEALLRLGESFADLVNEIGLSLDDLAALQSNYYEHFYTAEEQAARIREAALDQIRAWNAEMGLTGAAIVDSSEALRAYVDGLDLTTEAGMRAYVAAMQISTSFITLDEALSALGSTVDSVSGSVADFIASMTPEDVAQNAALAEMADLFAQWGMTIPPTSEALYALIQAGVFTDEQLQTLAEHSGELGQAWAAIATAQKAAIDDLESAYDAAVEAAKAASSARIDALREASNAKIDALRDESSARIKALRDQYDSLTDALNDQLGDARDSLSQFQRIVDAAAAALESLTQQTETSPDQTRQRLLAEAKAALEQFGQTGELPSNITDLISGLGTVDPNDFATREEWLAAIAENQAIVGQLEDLGGTQLDAAERQIALLEEQIKQAREQYEAAVDAENDRLDRAIKAERDNLEKAIAAEEDALEKHLSGLKWQLDRETDEILAQGVELVDATTAQNDILADILASVSDISGGVLAKSTTPSDSAIESSTIPAFASGGYHAGGLRVVGELGPELEYTGPSQITPNSDIGSMFVAGNAPVVDELRELRAEVKSLRATQAAQAETSRALLKIIERWNGEGTPPDRMDYAKTVAESV
ncbi:glycoside hydrolase family protein [Thiorhodococcus fuscus]|uniref:Lysozyme n=1 Tax=Thiorhodococcus fuscus TaxID=527200 RepID=A0ABW4Y9D4_9GAMM